MKKSIAVLAALTLLLSLSSCGGETGNTSSAASKAPASSAAPVSAESREAVSVPTVSIDTRSLAEKNPLNLSFRGTAISDGDHETYSIDFDTVTARLNDGDHNTRWQSVADTEVNEAGETVDIPEDEEHTSWFGILWEEEKTFDTIVCDWENAHPLEDGFSVEISQDGETWEKVAFTSVRTGTYNDGAETLDSDHQIDTITLKEAATAKAVRVFCFTHYVVPEGHENAGNTKSPTSCYEIEISYSVDVAAAEAEATESTESAADASAEDVTAE